MIKNDDELISEFIANEKYLHDYTKLDNIIGNDNYDPKISVKLGNKQDKLVHKLLQSETGIAKISNLLNYNEDFVSMVVARYLWPLYPKQCMEIIKKYKNSLVENLDIHSMDILINGLSSRQKVFMDKYKKLYNCEDLESLNREKQKNK